MGLTEVAGHYQQLKKGFDEVGVVCTYVNLKTHAFQYGSDGDATGLARLIRLLESKWKSITNKHVLLKYFFFGVILILRVMFFIYATAKYDIFLFGSNSSFFFFWDLPILRLLNKKIIYRFHGSDCRPPYLSGGVVLSVKEDRTRKLIEMSAKKKRTIKRIESFADVIISHPLFSHYLERPFVSGANIGLPCSVAASDAKVRINERRPVDKRPVRVVHSPSNPVAKGTPIIHQIVGDLISTGCPIELVEIRNQPNAVVRQELARCDFVIDQLYSDTPMAAFSGEAAVFSKPAVLGANGYDEFGTIYPRGRIPPSCHGHLSQIRDLIAKLVNDEDYRRERGKAARQFIEENWTPEKVAARYVRIMEDDIPADWWYDPSAIRYVFGSGMPKEKAKETVRSIIEKGGVAALQLSDKPELEKAFVDFAFS
ncbi:MAG: glycosyltransferase [Candidatus Hodarchaeota archaeon]